MLTESTTKVVVFFQQYQGDILSPLCASGHWWAAPVAQATNIITVPTRIRFLITPLLSTVGQKSGSVQVGTDAPNRVFMRGAGFLLSLFLSLLFSPSEWENWSTWGKKQLVRCWENPTDINLHESFTAIKARGNKTPTKSEAKRELHKHTYTHPHVHTLLQIPTHAYTHYYSPVVGYGEGTGRAGKTKTFA